MNVLFDNQHKIKKAIMVALLLTLSGLSLARDHIPSDFSATTNLSMEIGLGSIVSRESEDYVFFLKITNLSEKNIEIPA